jgi:riboflavin transporter FmnP
MNSRKIAFISLMSALGLLLSALSLNMAPIFSAVGQGGAALDFSLVYYIRNSV